jgi:hypothetical protein
MGKYILISGRPHYYDWKVYITMVDVDYSFLKKFNLVYKIFDEFDGDTADFSLRILDISDFFHSSWFIQFTSDAQPEFILKNFIGVPKKFIEYLVSCWSTKINLFCDELQSTWTDQQKQIWFLSKNIDVIYDSIMIKDIIE